MHFSLIENLPIHILHCFRNNFYINCGLPSLTFDPGIFSSAYCFRAYMDGLSIEEERKIHFKLEANEGLI